MISQASPPPDAEQRRIALLRRLAAIAPAATARGVVFPATAPEDMRMSELARLYNECRSATTVDPL